MNTSTTDQASSGNVQVFPAQDIFTRKAQTSWAVTVGLLLCLSCGCANPRPSSSEDALQTAETFITTFYSWDANALAALMEPSAEANNALYYQAWAEAAHYAIKQRRPCTSSPKAPETAICRITVTDDFGEALGYTATDTFTLQMQGNRVSGVQFAGDDPPVFEQVFAGLMADRPGLFDDVCKDTFAGGEYPAECARAVAQAAQRWAEKHSDSSNPDAK